MELEDDQSPKSFFWVGVVPFFALAFFRFLPIFFCLALVRFWVTALEEAMRKLLLFTRSALYE